jgi:hypothetical protein
LLRRSGSRSTSKLEGGKLQAVEEDQCRLEPAIGHEDVLAKLGEGGSILAHCHGPIEGRREPQRGSPVVPEARTGVCSLGITTAEPQFLLNG